MNDMDHDEQGRDDRSSDDRLWLVLDPDSVPDRWKERAFPAVVVPLTPEETAEVLNEGSTRPLMPAEEEAVARLAARGTSAEEIARELHMTSRSVYRRLARLRERMGARNAAELASKLSRSGF